MDERKKSDGERRKGKKKSKRNKEKKVPTVVFDACCLSISPSQPTPIKKGLR